VWQRKALQQIATLGTEAIEHDLTATTITRAFRVASTKAMDALQPKWMREGAKQSSTKVRLVTVSVLAILAIVVLAASITLSSGSQQSQTPLQRHHPHFQRPGVWQFDVARDARNLGMSEWQCDVCLAFVNCIFKH